MISPDNFSLTQIIVLFKSPMFCFINNLVKSRQKILNSGTIYDNNSVGIYDNNSGTIYDNNSVGIYDNNSVSIYDNNSRAIYNNNSVTLYNNNSRPYTIIIL